MRRRIVIQLNLNNGGIIYGTAPYNGRIQPDGLIGVWEQEGIVTVSQYPGQYPVATFYPWSKVENVTFVQLDDDGKAITDRDVFWQ